MKKIIYTLLIISTTNLAFATHEFYVSICDIQHNVEAATLEVTLKLFTNDFEKALNEEFGEKLELGTSQEASNTEELIIAYLQKYLHITVQTSEDAVSTNTNHLQYSFRYLGKEVEINEMWCYLEIENVPNIESIEVNNLLLTQSFPKQSNIVNIRANARLESLMLNKDKSSEKIEY